MIMTVHFSASQGTYFSFYIFWIFSIFTYDLFPLLQMYTRLLDAE